MSLLILVVVIAFLPAVGSRSEQRDMLGNKWPERLSTRDDIRSAKPDVESIDVWNLPIQAYPLLAKFTRVRLVNLDSREGNLATDDKLTALASVGFTNLTGVSLTNCRLITDKGIRALAGIRSLRRLGLEGTAITDDACELMASAMHLSGIDVANCREVTLKGIKALSSSPALKEFSFSADNVTQDQVLWLISSFRNVTWWEIVDPQGKLDAGVIKAKGVEGKLHVTIKRTGALQDKYGKND